MELLEPHMQTLLCMLGTHVACRSMRGDALKQSRASPVIRATANDLTQRPLPCLGMTLWYTMKPSGTGGGRIHGVSAVKPWVNPHTASDTGAHTRAHDDVALLVGNGVT
jgi:hypothetical protein